VREDLSRVPDRTLQAKADPCKLAFGNDVKMSKDSRACPHSGIDLNWAPHYQKDRRSGLGMSHLAERELATDLHSRVQMEGENLPFVIANSKAFAPN
jgi:hypothetical protein